MAVASYDPTRRLRFQKDHVHRSSGCPPFGLAFGDPTSNVERVRANSRQFGCNKTAPTVMTISSIALSLRVYGELGNPRDRNPSPVVRPAPDFPVCVSISSHSAVTAGSGRRLARNPVL